MSDEHLRGVWVPALTPFDQALSPNPKRFVAHCQWLLEQGADGLAVFGTTSEANSMTVEQKRNLLDGLLTAGVPAAKLIPGVGSCAIEDTVDLSREAISRGCAGVLMLPPFYYKGVGDTGLYEWFARVIDNTGRDDLKVFLYHIPPVSQVPISLDLVRRLKESYPGIVAGIKDSGGNWEHTRSLLEAFPDLIVFAGSEAFLLQNLRHGGAGCITASGNVNPAGIRLIYERRHEADADAYQNAITLIRRTLEKHPMIPALKALCANYYGDPHWRLVRPPLEPLVETRQIELTAGLAEIGFDMGANRTSVEAIAGHGTGT